MAPKPLPVLPGVYYARVIAHSDLHPISNVFTFLKAGLTLASAEDLTNAQAVSNAIAAHWMPWANDLLATTYAAEKASTYALGSPLLPAQETPISGGGTRTGTNHYDQVAGLLKHTVIRRGKGSQSRTFLSPLADVDITVNGDQMTSTWLGNASSFGTSFITPMIASLNIASPGTWTYVQLSKGTFGGVYGKTFPMGTTTPDTAVSSQRRRLQK